MVSLAVVLLTYNEEKHIGRALDSVRGIATEIFVIDSHSTDRTVEIAEHRGAVVLVNKFVNQAKQFQWALDNAPIRAEWVLRLDADEVVEPNLAEEIAEKLPHLPSDVTGINLKRKHIFMGRWVRHGGRFPLLLLRIFRRGSARIEDRWMDEHITVTSGRTITLNGCFADHNLNDIGYFVEKHNKYATREAIEILNQKFNLFGRDERLTGKSTSGQAAFKRWAKERVFNRMPFAVSSAFYFLWRYIVLLGFLDGRSGLVYHFLQGYWYRFLVGAKTMELEASISGLTSREEILAELSRVTGHSLVT
jgi:glycosyltransferase involved in cell wall biosynthesis